MEPGELIFVLSLLVFLPLAILRMTFKYHERKRAFRDKQTAEGSSLTLTELEVLVEDAVRRGVEPLEDRLLGVERKLEGLLPPASPLMSDDPLADAEPLPVATEKTVGKIRRLS